MYRDTLLIICLCMNRYMFMYAHMFMHLPLYLCVYVRPPGHPVGPRRGVCTQRCLHTEKEAPPEKALVMETDWSP